MVLGSMGGDVVFCATAELGGRLFLTGQSTLVRRGSNIHGEVMRKSDRTICDLNAP